ncbi:methyltransferase family protein [Emticicia sp. 17c]|uniref:methyltransferase family protein n=1 Tax=Emticicia sp. 17c TaxID=3127704 RepID=UPI00301B72D5
MREYIKIGINVLWGILMLYWAVSSLDSKATAQQEAGWKRLLYYWLPIFVSMYLLGPGEWFGHTWLRESFVPHTDFVSIVAFLLALLGLITACWARYLLGRNWSLSVQKKQDHELIRSGPYKWVRHPIYTGLLLLFTGTALLVGDYRGILAVVIMVVAFWLKLRKEEQVMAELFGEQYEAYRQQTKALIPFVW